MAKNTIDLDEAFAAIEALNPEACFLHKSTLSNVNHWYDTGCYALNAIMGGSCRKGGVPKGRMIVFTGDNSTGKTYITNKIIAIAQQNGEQPVVFDSENAVNAVTAAGVGLDPKRVRYVPVGTINEARNQLGAFLDKIIEKGLQGRFIVDVDSLGNLASTKEIADATAGKTNSDQGTRAKELKSYFRTLTYKAARAQTAILHTNHNVADPTAMYPSVTKIQSGGSGPLYMASIIVQLSKTNQVLDFEEALPESKKFNGINIHALVTKNRFIPPFLETDLELSWKTGLQKYSGLKEIAVNHGVIIQNGSTYALPDGTKLGYFKTWRDNTELFENTIIPGIDIKLETAFKYSAFNEEEEINKDLDIESNEE